MSKPIDLEVARQAFVEGVSTHDQRVPTITRQAAETTAKSICRTSNICTSENIEHSRTLILEGVLSVWARTAALKDYLFALSKAFPPRDIDVRIDTSKPGDENEGLGKIIKGKVQQPPQPAFKRLHLLYLLHDILLHARGNYDDRNSFWSLSKFRGYQSIFDQLLPTASLLACLAVCGCTGKATRTTDAVLHIVSTWKANIVFSPTECDDIVEKVRAAGGMEWEDMLSNLAMEEAKAKAKGEIEDDFDWVIPARHSNITDPNAPWHELPAANGLFMKRTRGFPMRADAFQQGGFELRGAGTRADQETRHDVMALYKDILRSREKYTDPDEVQDVDALGNVIWKDADRPTRNYWGWTLDGIETRKELAAQFAEQAVGYGDLPAVRPAGVNSAVERARALATASAAAGQGASGGGFGMGGGFGGQGGPGFEFPRGGFRGGGRGGFRGGYRGDFRGGHRGRPR